MTREEELDYLKDQAQAIGEQLEHIEKRIKEIEEEKQN
jgi:prefoldin subunit 5